MNYQGKCDIKGTIFKCDFLFYWYKSQPCFFRIPVILLLNRFTNSNVETCSVSLTQIS